MTSLGPYTLQRQLGEGGMGQVWAARDEVLGRDVAVKLITGERTTAARYRKRFRIEVQSMARLDHRGIVEVFDYASVDAEAAALLGTPIDSPYYVMELAEGTLADDPPKTWPAVLAMLGEVLDALAHSHSRGVIHRDLKPGNILICGGEARYKLADFGIAVHSHHWSKELELGRDRGDALAGSPHYMAPEQWLGKWRDYGAWTDLYALGCIAFELLCGRHPFEGDSTMALALAHTGDERPQFDPRVPVPDGLADWFGWILARNPRQRFRRAADAALALSQLPTVLGEATMPFLSVLERRTQMQPTQTVRLAELLDPILVTMDDEALETAPMVEGVVDEWRTGERGPRLRSQGMGLFGLRAPAMVDREAERDVLWSALRRAARSGRPQGVVIEGVAGIGKSRLAEWLCQRAEEVGGAKSLYVAHAPAGQFHDGIGPMLDNAFGAHGLLAEELENRVESSLRAASPSPAYADVLAADAPLIAEFLRPTEAGAELTRTQRNAAMLRLVKAIGATRALVFWVDDAQWAFDTLSFVDLILKHDRRLPVVVVLTLRTDRSTWSANVDDVIARLIDLDNVTRLELGVLESDDQRALIDDLLPLEAGLAERLASHTQGAPLFAIQTLKSWAELGALVRQQDHYTLVDSDLPAHVREACGRRLDYLEELFGDERSAVRAALEYAAAVGEHVDTLEWEAICADEQLDICARLHDELLVMGIARPHEGAWSFAHHTFRDVVLGRCSPARLEAVHRRWAAFLDAHHGQREYGIPGRLAAHWLAAGELEEAVQPLFEAAMQHYDRSEYVEALQALSLRGWTLSTLEVDPDDQRHLDNRVMYVWYLLNRGEVAEDARHWLPAGEELAARNGWHALAARQAHLRGYLALLDGDETIADGHFERACEFAGLAKLPRIAGHATRLRGYVQLRAGNFDRATTLVMQALGIFAELNIASGTSEARRTLASIALGDGDFEEAEAQMRTGLRELLGTPYRDLRATLLADLGELECRLGRYEQAERTLRESSQLCRHSGMSTFMADGNLGLAYLASGKYEQARLTLDDAHQQAAASGHPKVALVFRLAHDASIVRCGEGAESGVQERIEQLATYSAFDHHAGWVLAMLADSLREAGLTEIAEVAEQARRASEVGART